MDKFYRILGLKPDCSDDELKKRYRELALKYHPDKWELYPDSIKSDYSDKFQQITTAYEALREEREKPRFFRQAEKHSERQNEKAEKKDGHHHHHHAKPGHAEPEQAVDMDSPDDTSHQPTTNPGRNYFIVFYNYYGESSSGSGHTTFIVSAPFINRKRFIEFMEDNLRKKYEEDFTVIITNIIPLSEEQYRAWSE